MNKKAKTNIIVFLIVFIIFLVLIVGAQNFRIPQNNARIIGPITNNGPVNISSEIRFNANCEGIITKLILCRENSICNSRTITEDILCMSSLSNENAKNCSYITTQFDLGLHNNDIATCCNNIGICDSATILIDPWNVLEIPKISISITETFEETKMIRGEINHPVTWIKTIKKNVTQFEVELPRIAANISAEKIEENNITPIKLKERPNQFAIGTNKTYIIENASFVNIYYETPGPISEEREINKYKKQINVSSDYHYENILIYTTLSIESHPSNINLYHLINGTKELVQNITYRDTNDNGLVDRIEWITPFLSKQFYELVIKVSKAEHLDSNRTFISNIYEQVKDLDNNWSETIPSGDYVRVTFERMLNYNNDITIYPRITLGNPTIKIYEVESNNSIAEFTTITENEYNTVYLTNLIGFQDTFDLLILNGNVEFDHIVDPVVTTLVPSQNTQNTTSGALTENTFTFSTGTLVTQTCYTQINASGGNACLENEGTSALDAYFLWNITLPAYQSISSILLNSTLAQATTNGTDTLSIAAYNFSAGAWKFVNVTKNPGRLGMNVSLTFNITNGLVTNFVNATNRQVRFMARTNGSANIATDVQVDIMQAIVAYNTVDTTSPTISNALINATTNNTYNVTLNTRVKVNATVTDDVAVSNVTIQIDPPNSEPYNVTASNRSSDQYFNDTIVLNQLGYWNFTIWANDTSNNNASAVAKDLAGNNYIRVIDINLPNITNALVNLTGNASLNQIIKVNATVTDDINVSNVTIQYTLPNGTNINNTAPGRSGSEYFNDSVGLSLAGSWNFTFFANDTSFNNATSKTANVNVTGGAANTAPVITSIRLPAAQTITENSYINVTFFFNATDANGASDFNNTSARGFINKSAETSRYNFSCSSENINTTTNRYNCTVDIWYFDGDGDWTVNVSVKDNSSNYVQNTSQVFTVNPTKAMVINTNGLRWTDINLGTTNNLAANNITVNNTGNVNITRGNVTVRTYNLHGLTTASQFIYAANFSVNIINACEGQLLANVTYTNVTSSILTRGNHSINNGTSGQEQLAFCLENIDDKGLSVQAYQTVSGFPWEVIVG